MSLHFSEYPGRHERHLRRKQGNPLFPGTSTQTLVNELSEAQRLDHDELMTFISGFRELVQQAAGLQPNTGSESVLALKERLDQAYEQACRLADPQDDTKRAIVQLVAVIMQAVRQGAGNDDHALQQLAQEHQARFDHYRLLEQPLVADLLDPQSPIAGNELAATLLSSDETELTAALQLFDRNQLALLCEEARSLLDSLETVPPAMAERLRQLQLAASDPGPL